MCLPTESIRVRRVTHEELEEAAFGPLREREEGVGLCGVGGVRDRAGDRVHQTGALPATEPT